MKTQITTKVRHPRSVLDAVREAVAKYESEKLWGQVTISFQDGKPIMIEEKKTQKLSS